MKRFFIAFICFLGWNELVSAQSQTLFKEDQVAAIYLELPADSLSYMLGNFVHTRYLSARFIFDDGVLRDTLEEVGLRLRGNTSLGAQKKSFKISFNEFLPGREYQGVRKLNLRGQHNDPTMVREKLFYEVWKNAGMPERRAAFVKLFINQEYRGLYTNVEELDKIWLGKVYGPDEGNFYKCTWPADLVYLGADQQVYKDILNNPEERAYDLKTNESEDDYSGLVALMAALNQPVDANFPNQIRQVLNVERVLKSFAIDVATGNWDDYFYNKNNYFLYDHPTTGQFEFVTYDTDNTFGVDWLGKNWATRNCLSWLPSGQARPLATKLLQVPEFKTTYIRYLDTLTRFITHPDTLFPRIDAMRYLITPAASADTYRSLDYGYTFADFYDGFEQTIDGHTPYGIKPFLGLRYDSIRTQIQGLLSSSKETHNPLQAWKVFPNPAIDWLYVQMDALPTAEPILASIIDQTGRCLQRWEWDGSGPLYTLPVHQLVPGVYVLHLETRMQEARFVFLKAGL